VPSRSSERIAESIGKIDAGSNLPTRSSGAKPEENYERTTACERDFDSPQASPLGNNIEVPPCRSPLPAREGQKELLAFVRQV
jgi:hypothetical protein